MLSVPICSVAVCPLALSVSICTRIALFKVLLFRTLRILFQDPKNILWDVTVIKINPSVVQENEPVRPPAFSSEPPSVCLSVSGRVPQLCALEATRLLSD